MPIKKIQVNNKEAKPMAASKTKLNYNMEVHQWKI